MGRREAHQWRPFMGGGGHQWEVWGRVEVGAREVSERHIGEAKLVDGSAESGNHRRRPAPERSSRWMKNSVSTTLASRWPTARGQLLPWGGSWAHEGGGPRCPDTEASRRHLVRGAAWRLDEQRWSAVEEHSEARFMWGSEKRRLTSLGVELRGDKVWGGGWWLSHRGLTTCWPTPVGWQVGPRLPLI
jgi:hypothetical protein